MTGQALDFRMLGPLEVRDGERLLPLPSGKPRALFVLLLLRAGEVVSTDRIVDMLWGERPPASAANSVHVYVSQLRKLLGNDRLVRHERGYVLRVEPGELDLERFERLLAEGRSQLSDGDAKRAARTLADALGMWRGAPLADLGDPEFALAEIARLEELHVGAVEDRVDAELVLGRSKELVPELEALVRDHPLRERLRGQLMIALYRAGRQADALAAYRDARRVLVEELGLEPSPELQQLERSILAHDPELRPTRTPAHAVRSRPWLVPVLAGVVLVAVALGGFAYAEGQSSTSSLRVEGDAVAVIDPGSNRVVDGVSVGARPDAIGFGAGSIWVANLDDATVTRIDSSTRRPQRTISVADTPTGLAAEEGAVWVVGPHGFSPAVEVRRIDPQFDVVSASTTLGNVTVGGPGAITAGEGAVWVAPSSGLLARLDRTSARVRRSLDPNASPAGVAVGGGAVWVTDRDAGTVTRIDSTGLARVTAVGRGPAAVAFGAGAIWVANSLDDTVTRIDPATGAVQTTIDVGRRPTGIAVGAESVWVANSHDGTVARIDPRANRVVRTIRVGGSPAGLVVGAGRVWVTVDRPVAGDAPAPNGTLRVETSDDVDSLDPAIAYGAFSWQLLYATCAKLVTYPDREGASQLVPEVAQALPTRSADGLTYTFTIRGGFRFSPPSNEPVTAETFAYAIERSLSRRINGPARSVLGNIAGVVAHGKTLTIRLRKPQPDFTARLATPFSCAVPLGTPVVPNGLRTIPAAGPYYVSAYTPGQGIVLLPNPNYTGTRPHRPGRIEIAVDIPAHRALADVAAGRADWVEGLAADARAPTGGTLVTNPLHSVDLFALNTHRALFRDVRLRRAANFAIDRRALAKLGNGFGSGPEAPTDQYLPPGMPGYHDARIYPFSPEPARAQQLAGTRQGTAVLYTCNQETCAREAQIVETDLAVLGISVEVKTFDFATLNARLARPGEPFDIAYLGWVPDYDDPDAFLNTLLRGGAVLPTFDDPVYVQKLAAAAQLSGPERYLTYGRLDAELARDAAPWIAFGNATTTDFFAPRVGCRIYGAFQTDVGALCLHKDQ